MRTVTNTRVIDSESGSTIARITPDANGKCILSTPDGAVIGTCNDNAMSILLHLQISGY